MLRQAVRHFHAGAALAAKAAAPKAPVKKATQSFKKKTKSAGGDVVGSMGASGKLNERFYKPLPNVHLQTFLPETVTQQNLGQVFRLPSPFDKKTIAIAPHIRQLFQLSSAPALVTRGATLQIASLVDQHANKSSGDERVILSGEQGIGKSLLLLQAVSYALSNEWIVLYVPQAIKLVDSSTAYAPTEDGLYVQPDATAKLLQQFVHMNEQSLGKLPLKNSYTIEGHELKDMTILEAADIGIRHPTSAYKILETVLTELEQQSTPVSLAIDEVNALYAKTAYNDSNSKLLEASQLALPNLLLQYLSAQRQWTRGIVIGATSKSDTRFQSTALDTALGLLSPDPYRRHSIPLPQDLYRLDVQPYTLQETNGILEFYKQANMTTQSDAHHAHVASGGHPSLLYRST